ncbi:hypothetical protein [Halogeometricum sp. CBA1124]|uniref:hypothetical protein n=1 Tax=Halogeometricum sp. CBA1124 TaxID=2668071 RepID=UPI001E490B3D|nr:hypothetical protein [Halogeometricum sp. CBA1124]
MSETPAEAVDDFRPSAETEMEPTRGTRRAGGTERDLVVVSNREPYQHGYDATAARR